jgi:tetratricopeptide (TPR) repeat protein
VAAGCLLAAVAVQASNTYRPRLPPRLNKAFLAGEKLWKSKKIVGPGGRTCADCHDRRGGAELETLKLVKKREDLPKLIYFELVSRSANNLVEPGGAEVRALEAYLVERFNLDGQSPASGEGSVAQLAEARDLYVQGDYSAALAVLEEVLESRPPPPSQAEAHLLLGVIAHVLGDSIRARAEFAEVFRIEPDWTLDPEVFSPKTIELFESVRAATVGGP